LVALRAAMPAKAKDTAPAVVRKVVDELMAKLAQATAETIRRFDTTILDLFEGGNAAATLGRAETLVAVGVNLIVLLALSDDGRHGYDANHAGKLVALGCPGVRLHAGHGPRPDGRRAALVRAAG
jgi:hypothetical protein